MITIFICTIAVLYYLFTVLAMVTFIQQQFDRFTIPGALFAVAIAMATAPFYIPMLLGIKLGIYLAND